VPAGIISLSETTIVQPNDKMGKDNCFELQADKRIFYFYAGEIVTNTENLQQLLT